MEKVSKEEFDEILQKNSLIFSDDFHFDFHMLWHSTENTNKKNLLRYFIAKNYNQDYLKLEKHVFPISNNHDTFNIIIYKSNFHWELDFSWTGNNTNNSVNKNSNDQYVIDYFVNNFCKTFNINVENYKILVLFNTHRLTLNNQKMILRVMENAFANVKFIIITDAINRIDFTIKSRCLNVRIPYAFCKVVGNIKYMYNLAIDKKSQRFHFYRIIDSDENIEEFTFTTEINDLKIKTWDGNSTKHILDNIFNNIMSLKKNINNLDNNHFQNNYNKIIEDIDNYLLACNTIQDFIHEFIVFLMTCSTEKNVSKYVKYFAEIESLSLKCDYQIYLLESIITFFLMN